MMIGRTAAWIACLALGLGAAQADTVDVYSNAPGGDTVTTPAPIGSSGWSYDYVGAGGSIGINNNVADANGGNGSAFLQSLNGNEVDLTYNTGQPLGLLSNLTTLSYDWYRSSSSTTLGIRAPALALFVSDGASSGYLVYEPTYTEYPGNASVETGVWHPSNISALDGNLWSTGDLPSTQNYYDSPLAGWQSQLGGYYVESITAFIGSGWTDGTFTGAVDNIHIGFGTDPGTTYNFEVQPVPEPASVVSMLIAGGLGVAGAAYRRRRAR